MVKLNYEQLAIAALDALLAGELEITRHSYQPDLNECTSDPIERNND